MAPPQTEVANIKLQPTTCYVYVNCNVNNLYCRPLKNRADHVTQQLLPIGHLEEHHPFPQLQHPAASVVLWLSVRSVKKAVGAAGGGEGVRGL